jgi:MarR family transcriptional regulator, organic hydroperoxide resistance regulator
LSSLVDDRPDLAAMVVPLSRALLDMEAPILQAHALSMWGYIVLTRLGDQGVRGQAVLAEAIGADKTRIIDVLDDLQTRGLIRRDPDPADRRARLLATTAQGRRLRDQVRRAIRREEQRLLAALPAGERAALLRGLQRLNRAAGSVAP